MKSIPERLRPPLVAILALTAMTGWLNGAALSPFMPEMADDLNTSVPMLGQATSILFFLAAGISLVVGPLADSRGYRRMLVTGLLAVVVCSVGTAFATSFWLLALVRVSGAFAAGALGGLALAVAANTFDGNDRRRAIGWVAAGVAGGAVAGIPILTAIGSLGGWRVAFLSLAAVGLLLALLVRSALPDDTGNTPVDLRSILRAYIPLAASPNMRALYLASGLRSIGWMGFLVYAGTYYSVDHGLSVQEVGWTYMIGGLGFFLGIRTAGGRLDNRPLRPVFVGTSAFTGLAVGALLALPVDLFSAVTIMTVASFTLGISSVCISTMLASETPAGRGTTMSLNAAVLELATAFGGAIGGGLIALGGFTTLGAGLAFFSLLASAVVLYGARRPQRGLAATTSHD